MSVRSSIEHTRSAARRLTAAQRRRPDFLVIGAQKAGTTSLYAHLAAQADVLPARHKEIHFFETDLHHRGLRWYRSMFPLEAALQRRHAITGEATPDYVASPLAATRVRADLPDARLVVVLRDPLERALSHHAMNVRQGKEPLAPWAAFAAEADRLAALDAEPAGDPRRRNRANYIERGDYAAHLTRWIDPRPRRPLLVLFLESLVSDPLPSLRLLHEFLGIAPPAPGTVLVHENRGGGTSDPTVGTEGDRARWADHFAPRTHALARLLQDRTDVLVTPPPDTWPDWLRVPH
jgi:hypothetical protein